MIHESSGVSGAEDKDKDADSASGFLDPNWTGSIASNTMNDITESSYCRAQ
jgi:hypothetical protein